MIRKQIERQDGKYPQKEMKIAWDMKIVRIMDRGGRA